MKKSLTVKSVTLPALLLSVSLCGQNIAQNLYLQPAISVHHLFSDDLYSSITNDKFFRKVAYTPTIGLGYYHPQWRIGLETRYYNALVPNTTNEADFYIARTFFLWEAIIVITSGNFLSFTPLRSIAISA